MYKKILSLVLFLALLSACQKTIKPSDQNGLSFLVRLPSIAQARFEGRCVSEPVFLDQVIVQSPSALYYNIDFNHQRFEKEEVFTFGSGEVEDGTWLITFVGSSAITDESFRKIVPYDMYIGVDENNQ